MEVDPDEEGSVIEEQEYKTVQTPSTRGPETPQKPVVCEDIFCELMTVEHSHLAPPKGVSTPVVPVLERVNPRGVEEAIKREGRKPDPIPMPAKERERKVAPGEEDI